MSEIKITEQPKRPKYLIKEDVKNIKIKMTEDEKKVYTIADHNAKFVGLEKSNIPEIMEKTFKITTLAQVFEPIDNAIICVDENGYKINTNNGDYDCASCDQFDSNPTERHPHGHCKFAIEKWIEKFGSLDTRPEGLDELQSKLRKIGEEKQVELTPEEVLALTKDLPNQFTEDVKKQIGELDEDNGDSVS